ncbi:hypothetical protein HK101_003224 [Irineochytrium annulatum]|nr:hypothetical protein HK101_003224 [Irineochytrium annulatum]
MESMMAELEKLMGSGDFDSMFEGMMEQIMSKDLLYEPMKDLAAKYPGWLEEHGSTVSAEDLARYKRQSGLVCEILAVYDESLGAEEEGKRVVDLMQKMQECGNPPDQIMQELAPGMDLGADGLGKMPTTLPNGQECAIM